MNARDARAVFLAERCLRVVASFTVLAALFLAPLGAAGQGSVDLHTGTATYTVPIVTPPGTNGMGPSLALTYNSDPGNGWIGRGWNLSGLGYIERRGPAYRIAPDYVDPVDFGDPSTFDTFVMSLNGSHKLVYRGSDPGTGSAGRFYRTQIESFMKIQMVGVGTDTVHYWVVTDKNGVKYYFGQTADSRGRNTNSEIFRWYLDKVLDPQGVFWTVSYQAASSNIFVPDRLPKQIVYSQGGAPALACTPTNLNACRTVDFALKSKSGDVFKTYAYGGFWVKTYDQLLDRIEVKLGGQLVRRYALTHGLVSPSPARGTQKETLLTQVTDTGADGTTSLPTSFTYHSDADRATPNTLDHKPVSGTQPTEPMGGPFNQQPGACVHSVDLNGDGYPEILVGTPGTWSYYPNTSDLSASQVRLGNKVSISANPSMPSLCATGVRKVKHTRLVKRPRGVLNAFNPLNLFGSSYGWLLDPLGFYYKVETYYVDVEVPVHDVALMDIDGDGLPDVVDGRTGQWYWLRNLYDPGGTSSSVSFAAPVAISGSPGVPLGDENVKDINAGGYSYPQRAHRSLRFADMDGDGLVDIFWAEKKGDVPGYYADWTFTWRRNLGGGSFGAPVTVQNQNGQTYGPTPQEPYTYEHRLFHTYNPTYNANVVAYGAPTMDPGALMLADVNGDGLLDLVHQMWEYNCVGNINQPCHFPQNNPQPFPVHYMHMPNQGGGKRFVDWPTNADNSQNMKWVSSSGVRSALPKDALMSPTVHWVDMNGDGRPDLLVGTQGNWRVYPKRLQDQDFDPPIALTAATGAEISREDFMTITDIDGNGFPDLVAGLGAAAGGYSYLQLNYSKMHQNLLVATNPAGGTTEFNYRRLHSGNTVRWVVDSAKVGDALGGFSTTTYNYAGGLRVGWPHNEFRGYRIVDAYPPTGVVDEYRFHQDDAKKGLPERSTNRLLGGAIIETSYAYTATPASGVTQVQLASTVVKSVRANGTFKSHSTSFTYDDYGNVARTAVSGDGIASRQTDVYYTYNKLAWIMNRPLNRTEAADSSGAMMEISNVRFYYDGQAQSNVPPIAGKLTKQEQWGPDDWPATQYQYDGYGNVTGVTDPNGNTCLSTGYTSFASYDSTYRTFPIAETNALCQTSARTYWGLGGQLATASVPGSAVVPGALATLTDANNVRADSYWDPFGRIKATVVPPDTAAAPTQSFDYFDVGAGFFVESRARESTGGGTLDSTTIFDGLGRVVRTAREGDGVLVVQDTWYNALGLVSGVSVPYFLSVGAWSGERDATKPKTVTEYDAFGRPTKVTHPDGTSRTIAYDLWDVAVTDENGKVTTRTYDALGRLTSVVEPSGGGTTTYSYDNFGNTASGIYGTRNTIRDAAGNTQVVDFDTLGRKRYHYDPDLGETRYTYDANGNLIKQTDAKSQVIELAYDKLNRVTSRTAPGYTPPPATNPISYGALTAILMNLLLDD